MYKWGSEKWYSIIIFHPSKLWKAKFSILCDVIFYWWGCRGNLILITFGSERVKIGREMFWIHEVNALWLWQLILFPPSVQKSSDANVNHFVFLQREDDPWQNNPGTDWPNRPCLSFLMPIIVAVADSNVKTKDNDFAAARARHAVTSIRKFFLDLFRFTKWETASLEKFQENWQLHCVLSHKSDFLAFTPEKTHQILNVVLTGITKGVGR